MLSLAILVLATNTYFIAGQKTKSFMVRFMLAYMFIVKVAAVSLIVVSFDAMILSVVIVSPAV